MNTLTFDRTNKASVLERSDPVALGKSEHRREQDWEQDWEHDQKRTR
jgi:hypothetical protein